MSDELLFYIIDDHYGDLKGYNRDWIKKHSYVFRDDWVEINFFDKINGINTSYLLSYEKYEKLRNEYFNKKINKIKNLWKQN